MKINLSPQLCATPLTASVTGDILTLNGIPYDFGPLPEGGSLPRAAINCPFLVSDVKRLGGQIELTILLPHGPSASRGTLFPDPITTQADGPVKLPPFDGA